MDPHMSVSIRACETSIHRSALTMPTSLRTAHSTILVSRFETRGIDNHGTRLTYSAHAYSLNSTAHTNAECMPVHLRPLSPLTKWQKVVLAGKDVV